MNGTIFDGLSRQSNAEGMLEKRSKNVLFVDVNEKKFVYILNPTIKCLNSKSKFVILLLFLKGREKSILARERRQLVR